MSHTVTCRTTLESSNTGLWFDLQEPKKRADANTILQHDWMRENGTASERPLDNVILKRMRGFAAMNKLKKEALKVIAAGMSQEEIAGLRTMFQAGFCMLPFT